MTTTTSAAPGPRAGRRPLSPRRRAIRNRRIQYAILIAIAIATIFLADWVKIGKFFFDPEKMLFTLTHGLWMALYHTIIYSAGGFVLGLSAGTVLALMRLSSVGPYRWLATIYIEFFRGLPALVVFIALALTPLALGFQLPWDPFGTVWLALGIVGAAYMAETIRAGVQAVPRGQVEAARSLGMPSNTAMKKIVLPQAFRMMLPPLTNELILLVKDSSLVFAIGIAVSNYELTKFGRGLANDQANITPLVIAGFGYLLITLPLSYVVRRLEVKTGSAVK